MSSTGGEFKHLRWWDSGHANPNYGTLACWTFSTERVLEKQNQKLHSDLTLDCLPWTIPQSFPGRSALLITEGNKTFLSQKEKKHQEVITKLLHLPYTLKHIILHYCPPGSLMSPSSNSVIILLRSIVASGLHFLMKSPMSYKLSFK